MQIKIIRKSVKNLILKIRPNGEIEVTAPKKLSENYIREFILRKTSWIEKKLKEIEKRKTKEISYLNGEKIFYLGKEYNFFVEKNEKDYVEKKDDENKITLFTKFSDNLEMKKEIMNSWYREEGKKVFTPILEKYLSLTGKKINKLTVKTLKSNWGSCNYKKGYINLNSEMMKRDIKFIEYVILHEIAHLEYPDHSRNFYGYIEKFMPDWKERKKL